MSVVGRFAPSPTGPMHLGNLRTALLAWLQIRALNGTFILRIEDLDTGRCREAADQAIFEDLRWLGLDWDVFCRQSARQSIYEAQLGRLETYACSCSRKDVREALSAPHVRGRVYPGTCLNQPLNPHKPCSLRWHTPDRRLCVSDLYRGRLCAELKQEVGDFVLRRNDGAFAYHLASVIDDGLMGVTHVTRGADLWRATPQQVALQEALGFARPIYAHVPLMKSQGQRMAKRERSPGLAELRGRGYTPERVLGVLARSLHWPVPKAVSLADLLQAIASQEITAPLFKTAV